MATNELCQKQTALDVVNAGDFCFTANGTVILACPFCGVVFHCHHEVQQRDPLTLSPSVVGPLSGFAWGDDAEHLYDKSDSETRSQVLAPCSHHFWIRGGKVLLHYDD